MCVSCYCDNKLTKKPSRIAKENKLPMEVSVGESPFRNVEVQLRKQGTQQQNIISENQNVIPHLLFTKANQYWFLIVLFPNLTVLYLN